MEDKILWAIERANKLVEKSKVQDPELKKIAFSKAIDFFLAGEIEAKKTIQISSVPVNSAETVAAGDFWTNLSRAIDMDIPTLKDIYSLKKNKIYLVISRVKGVKKIDQQRYLSVLILYAYHEGMKFEWVFSNLLAEAARHSSLYNKSNFSENVSGSDWFRTDGIKKGLRYKLSASGIAEAKSYFKELSTSNYG